MKDEDKTKGQLLNQIAEMRERIAELEASASRMNEAEEILRTRTHDLGERVKELNCLYGISRLLEKPRISIGRVLQGVVDLIPPAWQYPEITCAGVSLHDRIFTTKNFKETMWNQSSDIASGGERIGALQVYYLEKRPERDEGPFLKEERSLLNAIAERLGRVFERKQAEEEKEKLQAQLQHAHKMEALGTLAGGIAHTFNNLLMAIMANISVMLLESDPAHPHHEKLTTIERIIGNGSKLTKQLLEYATEGTHEIRTLNLNQVVNETSEVFGMTRKDVTIHRELAEGLFEISADRAQIEQVLWNLYVNAADAMPNSGELYLKTMNITDMDISDNPDQKNTGDYVLVVVRDTGVGMDKKTLKRIFDPFFTTKGLGAGTGLGLAGVHGIIKAHGGYVEVVSQKGEGTRFEIYLPASEKRVGKAVEGSEQIVAGSEKFQK
jgi:signal transduction histidine kinase